MVERFRCNPRCSEPTADGWTRNALTTIQMVSRGSSYYTCSCPPYGSESAAGVDPVSPCPISWTGLSLEIRRELAYDRGRSPGPSQVQRMTLSTTCLREREHDERRCGLVLMFH